MTNLKVCRVEVRASAWSVLLQINTRVLSNNSVFFLIYFLSSDNCFVICWKWTRWERCGRRGRWRRQYRLRRTQFSLCSTIFTKQRSANGAPSREQRNRTMDMVCNCKFTTNHQNHWLEVIFSYYNWNCFSNSLIRSQELCSRYTAALSAFVLSNIWID